MRKSSMRRQSSRLESKTERMNRSNGELNRLTGQIEKLEKQHPPGEQGRPGGVGNRRFQEDSRGIESLPTGGGETTKKRPSSTRSDLRTSGITIGRAFA